MPNWTTNLLSVEGPEGQVKSLLAHISSGEGPLDFNVLLPMPPILRRVISPVRLGPNGRAMLYAERGSDGDQVEATAEEAAELAELPYESWYDFATFEWGTKWNAKFWEADTDWEVSDLEDVAVARLRFDTAWSEPAGYLHALDQYATENHPGVTFWCESDHECGSPSTTFRGGVEHV